MSLGQPTLILGLRHLGNMSTELSSSNIDAEPKKARPRVLIGALLMGLLGVGNFGLGWWSLLAPRKGETVYFWLVQFQQYALLPSLLLFALSLFVIFLWAGQATGKFGVGLFFGLAMLGTLAVCFLQFGLVIFITTLRLEGQVAHNQQVYYLISYFEDEFSTHYAFCPTDRWGFAGQCEFITWHPGDQDNPQIYLDPATNAVTVKLENPAFIWTATADKP